MFVFFLSASTMTSWSWWIEGLSSVNRCHQCFGRGPARCSWPRWYRYWYRLHQSRRRGRVCSVWFQGLIKTVDRTEFYELLNRFKMLPPILLTKLMTLTIAKADETERKLKVTKQEWKGEQRARGRDAVRVPLYTVHLWGRGGTQSWGRHYLRGV